MPRSRAPWLVAAAALLAACGSELLAGAWAEHTADRPGWNRTTSTEAEASVVQ